jgi:AcrR family transcriptional regulator
VPRPNQTEERRRELVPVVARTFAELGYRRTTTAELAARCDVRENILYRLWADKRAMFVAALDHVVELSEATWEGLLARGAQGEGTASPAELLLDYEAEHQGEFGLYRLVFAGLSETDDPEIARAMKRLYGRFQAFVAKQVAAHRGNGGASGGGNGGAPTDAGLAAWAIVGLGTVSNIGRELDLLDAGSRRRLIGEVGRELLGPR